MYRLGVTKYGKAIMYNMNEIILRTAESKMKSSMKSVTSAIEIRSMKIRTVINVLTALGFNFIPFKTF